MLKVAADPTTPPAVHPLDAGWGPDRFALVSPFLIWNAFNGWASFQYWTSYSQNHSAGETPLDFLINQILIMNPLSVFLWVAGLWYFFSARGKRYRVFAWAYLMLFVLFIMIQGKSYFLAPAYPPLFAGGAMLFGEWRVRWRRWAAVYPVVLAVIGVLLAPAVMPVLPLPLYAHIYGKSGNAGSQQESGDVYGLPQALADRFGWEQQVALIAQVYHSLPRDEQRVACIFTSNYGEAGALVQFGGRYHLPRRLAGTTLSISGDRKGVPARSSSRSIFLPRTLHGGSAR